MDRRLRSSLCCLALVVFSLGQITCLAHTAQGQLASNSPPSTLGPIAFNLQGGTYSFSEKLSETSLVLYYVSNPQAQITIAAQASTPVGQRGTLAVNLKSDTGVGKTLSISDSFTIKSDQTVVDSTIDLHYEDPNTGLELGNVWGLRFFLYVKPGVMVKIDAPSMNIGDTANISGTINPPAWTETSLSLDVVRDGTKLTSLEEHHVAGQPGFTATYLIREAGSYTVTATCRNLNYKGEITPEMMTAEATASFTVTGSSSPSQPPDQQPSPTPNPTPTDNTDQGGNLNIIEYLSDILGLPPEVVVIVILFAIGGFAVMITEIMLYNHREKKSVIQKQESTKKSVTGSSKIPRPGCPSCGHPLSYDQRLGSWYCEVEKKTVLLNNREAMKEFRKRKE